MYIILDQSMPLDFDGKIHYLVLQECSSLEESNNWVETKKLEKNTYKILYGRKFSLR
jgi:hypothetical protein